MDANKEWMAKGHIGCTFASLFAKAPAKVGWVTVTLPIHFEIPSDAFILSLQFPGQNREFVFHWAVMNGFYIEDLGDGCTGLRRRVGNDIAWVQYFGPDSHVKTRQAPIPELMLCVKRPAGAYFKVGYNGILHLAHAAVDHLTKRKADKLWETSHIKTEKLLGHRPYLSEAAKTTYNTTAPWIKS